MEAARRLGIATRFVSGYLYDPALDKACRVPPSAARPRAPAARLAAGLPARSGLGPFDPTNNLLGGYRLIRVGVARNPCQAAPVTGSRYGDKAVYIGMTASVQVRRRMPPT